MRTHLSRLAEERGIALPIAIMAGGLVLMLAGFAAWGATSIKDAGNEDRRVKAAVHAADGGVEVALNRLNMVSPAASQPCVAKAADGTLSPARATAAGWCEPVTETFADGTTATYQVSAPQTVPGPMPTLQRKIVSRGLYAGTDRRVMVTLAARPSGSPTFGEYAIAARETITMENEAQAGDASAPVNIRANGNIEMKNGSEVCGNVTPGPGKTLTIKDNASVCPGYTTAPATEPLVFPPVDMGNAWTVNDNARLQCQPGGDTCTDTGDGSGVEWKPGLRELIVQNNAKLTLGGDVYALCRLNLKGNSQLIIAPRTTALKIYIGSPERCGWTPGEAIMIENGIGITNPNGSPATLQIFVEGSPNLPSKVNFKNTSVNSASMPLVLYAPYSEVLLENNARFTGGIVGKTVTLKNGAYVSRHDDTALIGGGTAAVYAPTRYQECAPAPAAGGPPDSRC